MEYSKKAWISGDTVRPRVRPNKKAAKMLKIRIGQLKMEVKTRIEEAVKRTSERRPQESLR